MVTNLKGNAQCEACKSWFNAVSDRILLPEIADYELRRELIRAGKVNGLRRLDEIKKTVFYLPITTELMIQAAQLWAQARNEGYPTASPEALDGDVILAAQAILLRSQGYDIIIATTNVGHLNRFTLSFTWDTIG